MFIRHHNPQRYTRQLENLYNRMPLSTSIDKFVNIVILFEMQNQSLKHTYIIFSNRQCHYNNKRIKTIVGKLLAALNTETFWLLYTFNFGFRWKYLCLFVHGLNQHAYYMPYTQRTRLNWYTCSDVFCFFSVGDNDQLWVYRSNVTGCVRLAWFVSSGRRNGYCR